MAETDDELDVGPLSEHQLRGLADDLISQLERVAEDLAQYGLGPMQGTLAYVRVQMGRKHEGT